MRGTRRSKYPVYVLSKGRHENNACLTARFLLKDNVHFYLVVEAQEYELYKKWYPDAEILVLPPESTGRGAIPVRNWIWEHSMASGFSKHWELDDNIYRVRHWTKGRRIECDPMAAIKTVEEWTDRYENVGISGLNYVMFGVGKQKPILLNCHVYSFMLIDNSMPLRWRGNYNADTDLCLQALSIGKCTAQFNVFLAEKVQTMKLKGGNTGKYQGDGRLKMARHLERLWPNVVEVRRRFGRPQHYVNWAKFDVPLIKRTDIDWDSILNAEKKEMTLVKVK
jgi:hypothetical protein